MRWVKSEKNKKGLPYRKFINLRDLWEKYWKSLFFINDSTCDFQKMWLFCKKYMNVFQRFAIDNRHLIENLGWKTDFFVYLLLWWNEKVNNLVTILFLGKIAHKVSSKNGHLLNWFFTFFVISELIQVFTNFWDTP